jgi:hypothetical protein
VSVVVQVTPDRSTTCHVTGTSNCTSELNKEKDTRLPKIEGKEMEEKEKKSVTATI